MMIKISVKFVNKMVRVILFGVFCLFVFLINVIILLRKFLFGCCVINILIWFESILVLLVIEFLFLFVLWIIGVDLLVMVFLLMEVNFLIIFLLVGIVLLVL